MKTYTNYDLKDGTKIYYDIYYKNEEPNGFLIYFGESTTPIFKQPEPHIPHPDKSYEENAILFAQKLSDDSKATPETPFTVTEEMYLEQQANIDYLLLLTE